MLAVRDLSKTYFSDGKARTLFSGLSFNLPARGRMAILGRNGQGKSTLIKILGGVTLATEGSVRWSANASWPIGFGGAFQGGMTGYDNIRFISRIYRRDPTALIERVDGFAELGESLAMPVKYYSSGMKARLAFGLSLAIDFDCYLIDEIIAVGDGAFRQKCDEELFNRRSDRTFIIASHDLDFLLQYCTSAIIIEKGRAKVFDDVELAVEIYRSLWEEHYVHGDGSTQALIG